MNQPIFILGALREEISQIRKLMIVKEQFKARHADVWIGTWEGVGIVLVRTGIGKDCALIAMKEVLKRTVPALVLSVGYAGALDLSLNVGDLVVADKILEIDLGTTFSKSYPVNSPKLNSFKGLISQEEIKVYKGSLLTVNQVISDSSTKQELGVCHQALAVDMETSSLIAHSIEKQIPFVSVRVISDTMDQSLMNISSLVDEKGEVSKVKAGWYAITHPHIIKNLISLRSQSQKATANLTKILGAFLQTL